MLYGHLFAALAGQLTFEQLVRFVFPTFRVRFESIEKLERLMKAPLSCPPELTSEDFALLKATDTLELADFEYTLRAGLTAPVVLMEQQTVYLHGIVYGETPFHISDENARIVLRAGYVNQFDGIIIDQVSFEQGAITIDDGKVQRIRSRYNEWVAIGALPAGLSFQVIVDVYGA